MLYPTFLSSIGDLYPRRSPFFVSPKKSKANCRLYRYKVYSQDQYSSWLQGRFPKKKVKRPLNLLTGISLRHPALPRSYFKALDFWMPPHRDAGQAPQVRHDRLILGIFLSWDTALVNPCQGPGFFHVLQFKRNFSIFQIQGSDLGTNFGPLYVTQAA